MGSLLPQATVSSRRFIVKKIPSIKGINLTLIPINIWEPQAPRLFTMIGSQIVTIIVISICN